MAVRWLVGAVPVVVLVVLALTDVAVCLQSVREESKCSLGAAREVRSVPDFKEVLDGSYSLTVEMTSETDNTTVYVTEVHEVELYHDTLMNVVGVTVEMNGTTLRYQYYPNENILVQEYDGSCHELAEPPTFPWGWWDQDENHGAKSFGPSSILRLTSYLTTEQISSTGTNEGVTVDVYKACAANNDVELQYHFSKPPWSMPEASLFEGNEGSLPVMMTVAYVDGFKKWMYTIVDFVPYITSHSSLEPPRGMACEGIVGILNVGPVPSIPSHFSLAEEVVINSVIDGLDFGNQYMDKIQFTYASELSLVSGIVTLPYDNSAHTAFAVRFIHDFNTGVQYGIYKEFGNCSMDFIPASSFDTHYGGFLGTGGIFVSPNDLFYLNDQFAFVGERVSRDILGDLWTSTRLNDIPSGPSQNFEKAVLEYYFSQGAERQPTGELTFTDLPFRGDLFVYNKSNLNEIVGTLTTNFYNFRIVNILSPDEFSVEECYEAFDDNWSYLDIVFPAKKKNQMEAAAAEQTLFKHEVMLKLVEIGRLSPVRIASIDINTGISGVLPNTSNADIIVAKVKLLERAPYIFSYRQPPGENPKPGKNQKVLSNIVSSADCATICYSETSMDCKSFHHCSNEKCYLSKLPGQDGGDIPDLEASCTHWVFDLYNQSLEDYPSEMVYRQVFEAVKGGDFIFDLPYKNNTVQVGYEASTSLHYRTPDPMDPIRMQFRLEDKLFTVENPDDTIEVADLTECMVLCVGWVRYRCETIVHQVDEGLCLLLSRHYHDLNHTELVPHSHSFVHGRAYIIDYNPILGGVALNSNGPSYSPVEHLDMCARYCTKETSIKCQSFEYCPSNQMCHLHEEHYLDVADSGDYTTGTACIHFSRKTDADFTKYEDQSLTSSQHRIVSHLTSSEICAKMCMEDTEEVCQGFDFCSKCNDNNLGVCGEENKDRRNVCFLTTHHLGESGLKLTTAKGCDHYDRNDFWGQDYASYVSVKRQSSKPYTPGDMTGLAFGMIFLGILLTVGFLAAITALRPKSVPKDLELSFQKLQTSGESDT